MRDSRGKYALQENNLYVEIKQQAIFALYHGADGINNIKQHMYWSRRKWYEFSSISIDETTNVSDTNNILNIFEGKLASDSGASGGYISNIIKIYI